MTDYEKKMMVEWFEKTLKDIKKFMYYDYESFQHCVDAKLNKLEDDLKNKLWQY
jgi:virulence-associated protein VapD